MTGTGRIALMRPHWSAAASSMPGIRPANAPSISRNQRSSAAALRISGARKRDALSYLSKDKRPQKQIVICNRRTMR